MRTIAYSSSTIRDVSDDELSSILTRAREKNARLQITGALLHRNGRFIQIIEGPEDAVRSVYASIVADPRHQNIHLVADERIAVRRFPAWTMGYQSLVDVPGSEIPCPENLFGAYPPTAGLPDDFRGTQSLFDWLYEYWITPVEAPMSPVKADDGPARVSARVKAALLSPAVQAPDATPAAKGSSVVVTSIFDKIMTDVNSGVLLPGDVLRDAALAELLGTSRTPVREALQKLRTIGVVEASANRFTRVAIVSPEKAAQSIIVLAALYSAILDEVIGAVDDHVIEAMKSDQVAFLNGVAAGNPLRIANLGATFYLRLVGESDNQALQQGINTVVHVVKLAGEHLNQIGISAITASMEVVLAATVAGNLAEAHRGLEMLTESPQSTPSAVSG
ncbi:MAG: BLUF domain-containing protein [Kineosporiaceae bacterium]|nr:BLUF domain-containing protein [Aeromicrobium sp.]